MSERDVSEIALVLAWTGALFALDQWSKRLVIRFAAEGPAARSERRDPLRQILRPRSVPQRPRSAATSLTLLGGALVSVILLHRSGSSFQTPAARFGLAGAFGGAASNLFDTLRRRAVIDFIDLRWWPAFNLADVAIVGGLIVAFWQR